MKTSRENEPPPAGERKMFVNQKQSLTSQPPGPLGFGALIEGMRIPHWIKNAFVAAPILFSGQFLHWWSLARCLAAVIAYCLLSSCVYLFNDVCDRDSDRAHPTKRNRPVASGRLSVSAALVASGVLLILGLGIAIAVEMLPYDPTRPLHGLELVVWTGAYLVLNLLYSSWLKNLAIVDVIVVAMGFVLRAMAGAAAIQVAISPWLMVCTFTLCLFIALTKRRSEMIGLSADVAGASREVNQAYDLPALEHMLTVSTAMAILTYSLYCLAPRTIANMGSAHMVWTIPVVVYGIFRFNCMTHQADREDPVRVLVQDRVLWAVLVLYCALVVLIKLFGSHPSVNSILDMGKGIS